MKHFIIYLSQIEESIRTATNLKNKLETYEYDVELFKGIYGPEAITMMEEENRILFPWGVKGKPAVMPTQQELEEATKNVSPGIKGCFYSHYNLWKKCVDIGSPIVIWEDDIVINRPFKHVDWNDVLILALGHPKKSLKYIHYFENPEGKPKSEDYYQSSMPGCCGYAIKPHAAEKLLRVYEKSFLPADNAINVYHVNIQIHNYIMGIALTKKDGKESLTRASYWKKHG